MNSRQFGAIALLFSFLASALGTYIHFNLVPQKTEKQKSDLYHHGIERFEYDGHWYISKRRFDSVNIWLDPDCPKCNQKIGGDQ